MKPQKHLLENQTYLIENHSVARNPLFADDEVRGHFIRGMKKYLSPLCKIISYNLNDQEFQILLRLKDREFFENAFLRKEKNKAFSLSDIPESTYIFSQAMANLQVSLVKFVNYRFGRTGSLMARRFGRTLIENEQEFINVMETINSGKLRHQYSDIWANDLMKMEHSIVWPGFNKGGQAGFIREIKAYCQRSKIDLVGHFNPPPKYHHISPKNYFLHRINRIFYENLD